MHGSAQALIGHVNYRLLENLEKLLDPACVFEKKEREEEEIKKTKYVHRFFYIFIQIYFTFY